MTRDEAISGIPTQAGDRLAIFGRSRLATAPTIRGTVWLYDPAANATSMMEAVLTMTTTDFSQEATGNATMAKLPPGCIIVGVTLIGSSNTNPVGMWAAAVLFRGGSAANSMFLCDGYLTNDSTPCWPKGYAINGPKANPKQMGALFFYSATQVNGGANAGDHVYTFTPAAGSRFRVLGGILTNGDASNRVATANILVGTDVIGILLASGVTQSLTVVAGTAQGIPNNGLNTSINGSSNIPQNGWWVADGATLVITLAAVAVSQDSALTMMLEVWGAAPTVTETGPAGSTPTIVQELVLTG